MDDLHLNNPGALPPVGCPLLIEVGNVIVPAERTGHVTDKDNQLEYVLADESKIIGRFKWTYP